jgi:hypothetical protein
MRIPPRTAFPWRESRRPSSMFAYPDAARLRDRVDVLLIQREVTDLARKCRSRKRLQALI